MPGGILLGKPTTYELLMYIHGSHTHHYRCLATRSCQVPPGGTCESETYHLDLANWLDFYRSKPRDGEYGRVTVVRFRWWINQWTRRRNLIQGEQSQDGFYDGAQYEDDHAEAGGKGLLGSMPYAIRYWHCV